LRCCYGVVVVVVLVPAAGSVVVVVLAPAAGSVVVVVPAAGCSVVVAGAGVCAVGAGGLPPNQPAHQPIKPRTITAATTHSALELAIKYSFWFKLTH
jgi:hypothetical protein